MRKFAILLLVFCAVAAAHSPLAVAQKNSPRRPSDPTEARQKDLSRLLRRYERLRVNAPETVEKIKRGERLSFLTSEGNLEVELTPNDLRAAGYRAEETGADGSKRPVATAAETRTFRGKVQGMDQAEARFNLKDGSFEGMIVTEGERFYFERLKKYEEAAEADEFIFYRGSDVLSDAPGYCGVTLEAEVNDGSVNVAPQVSAAVEMAGATLLEAAVATEADYEYVTQLGGSAPANADILAIMNLVDGIYETQLGLSLKVVYQHTWASKPTGYPYTATLDGPTVLNEFTNHWNQSFANVPRDLAHLWTGKDIASNGNSNLAGIAWVGVVCRSPSHAYGVSQRFVNTAVKQALTAHEMGHNFSANHSDAQTGCAGTIMSSTLSSTLSFCSFSRSQIQTHTGANGACLTPVNAPAPAALSSVTLGSASTALAAPVTGTVTLTAAAPANGAVVTLSDNLAATTLPASVLVPAGQTKQTFTITSVVVAATQTGAVTAAYNGVQKTAAFSVVPGLSIGGTVLEGTAGRGGVTLTLSSTTAGFTARTATSAATGAYSFTGLPSGRTYVVTPSSPIFNFTTANKTLTNVTTSQTAQNFTVSSRKTYSVAGRVTRAGTTTGIGGVTLRLTNSAGALVKSAVSAADGNFTLSAVTAGFNYTVTPALAGHTFSPATRAYTNLAAGQTAQNFTGSSGFTISGKVLNGTAGLAGIPVRLASTTTGFTARTATTAADGSYSFTSVPGGRAYTVTPSSAVFNFTPATRSYAALAASQTAQNFAVASRKTYYITGRVAKTTGNSLAGVTVTLTNSAGVVVKTVKSGADGVYWLTAIPAGLNYTVRPAFTGWAFTPATRSVNNLSANVSGQGFVGAQ
ncbi:MAG TPA: carboxypeptidase regulatory-like domain-containing protein [Pyrinomonadaceae bacterium]|nr:carboxypeptidase regulatory-like domain-containing protein [Pyrinomonadaceae bacterium]